MWEGGRLRRRTLQILSGCGVCEGLGGRVEGDVWGGRCVWRVGVCVCGVDVGLWGGVVCEYACKHVFPILILVLCKRWCCCGSLLYLPIIFGSEMVVFVFSVPPSMLAELWLTYQVL